MVVTDGGHVWQWSAAIPELSELSPALGATQLLPAMSPAAALLKPKLIGAPGEAVGKLSPAGTACGSLEDSCTFESDEVKRDFKSSRVRRIFPEVSLEHDTSPHISNVRSFCSVRKTCTSHRQLQHYIDGARRSGSGATR